MNFKQKSNRLTITTSFVLAGILCAETNSTSGIAVNAFDGWHAMAPRQEIKPTFTSDRHGGRDGRGSLVITSDQRPGLQGRWEQIFPVEGGRWYQFRAWRKTHRVEAPQRSAHVELHWSDDAGHSVVREIVPGGKLFALETFFDPLPQFASLAGPELPRDGVTDSHGWTEVSAVVCAPRKAKRAKVELHFRWAAGGSAEWSEISLVEARPPSSRKARLATVQLKAPEKVATTPLDACSLYARSIEEAARQKADIVCLTEVLTSHFTGLSYAKAAESIPGPSTAYFAELAKKHNLYIVAGLVERDGPLIYNTAALIGPDGTLVGKYRKVCLTRDEGNEIGVCPGDAFPVFETRFGKVGIMTCWDLQFPEVARALRDNGAEIILVPIAGGNPIFASSRAVENQVYVVMSAWGGRKDWLKTGIYDWDGKIIAASEESGVAVAAVDLGAPKYWAHLGDLKASIDRQRPALTR